jgi:maltose alpha-D-glucosyltransferase/alpha-amylase
MAIRMEDRFPIVDILQETPAIPDVCQWALFLRNHDELTLEMVTDEERDYMYRVYAHDSQARVNLGIRRRLAPLLNNDIKKIELMNSLLYSLPGTPIIYYGDEIGMGDNFYLGDRNGVRTPMQWSADRNAGFSHANPQRLYLPVIIDPEYHYEAVNVEAQQSNPDSLLWWMKRIIALRKRFRALSRGSLEFLLPENRKVLAFLRRYEDETILVVANLSRLAQHTTLNLAEFTGLVPMEVFAQADFPPIGETSYFLTLGPYDFYWFSLQQKPAPQVPIQVPSAKEETPIFAVAGQWRSLFRKQLRPAMEALLLGYIRGCRWFGGKARRIQACEIRDAVPVPYDRSVAYLTLVSIEYSEGEPETYLLPLAFASGEQANRVAAETPKAVVARLRLTGLDGDKEGVLYDALASSDFDKALLGAIGGRRHFKAGVAEVRASPTRYFRRMRGPAKTSLEPALLTAEQSNTSVVYADRLILKVFRRLQEGTNPDLEVGRFLTERVLFPHIPHVAGGIEYYPSPHAQAMTVGVLQEYVPNEGDAWKYTLDSLAHYFESVLAHPEASIPPPPDKPLTELSESDIPLIAREAAGVYLSSARLLGQRTGELHLALASKRDDPDFAPEPFTVGYQRSVFHHMRSLSTLVLLLLGQRLEALPKDAREEAMRVLGLQGDIIAKFKIALKHKAAAMRTRCHGDYHLGQVLYTGKDFVIIDFEGEPARPLGERRLKRSPLSDVAGMIRSFDYAAHAALLGQAPTVIRPEDLPILEQWARLWYVWVSAAFLTSYLAVMEESELLPSSREELTAMLDTYLLEKAVYELGYELNNRPDWVRVPLRGILQLVESAV